jgi:cellulose synthase/poly-beta-1,6-N-acetylglucosamine synthase-like glycosyltransferase/tetratricopeptide (TPR) repeat protein
MILVSFSVCIFYLVYRLFTLNLTTPYAVAVSVFLYLGEFYGVFVLTLFFLQVWDSREPPQEPILEGRTVDVFVPTYNEDPQMLRATLEACSRLEYPHTTYLCDDGGTAARLADKEKGPAAQARAEVLKKICAELGIRYMPRPDNRHAKAGNLNHAFEKTDGEFIIILDADHVPEPHLITRLIGYFRDEKLGFVQTPHAFYNFDNFQARLDHKNRRYWEEGHLFYEVIQPGRNLWNCPIFAGSAAMFRRKALKEVGYIATETITEDMHTGMRVNAKGWKSKAISERLVAGQAAPDVTTFHSQRIRWGEGNLSIMAYDNPLTMKGLTLGQRLCYFGSMVHWAGGLFKLAIYVTPLLMMFTGVPPVAEFTWALALITLLYLFASIYGVRVASNGFGSFFNGELFCMVNFWTQIRGTMKALFWRKFQSFVVTSKRGRQSKSIWPYVRPQVLLLAVSAAALTWGWYKVVSGVSDDYFKPIIPTFWILFHALLGLLVVRRALWPEDRRFSTRHVVNLAAEYRTLGMTVDGNRITGGQTSGLGVTADLNEIGVGLVAYEPLPVGSLIEVTLHGRGEIVTCLGEIRWQKDQSGPAPKGAIGPQGFRHGIAFRDQGPKQTDALNRLTLHYAVPRLYSEYAQGKTRTFGKRFAAWLSHPIVRRRDAIRSQVRLPVIVKTTQPACLHSVTEDVSRSAMSVLLPAPLEAGSEVDIQLATPVGEVRGRARVQRHEPRHYAGKGYALTVLEYLTFEEQGRVSLEMLINPREYPDLTPVLNPDRGVLPVPIKRPLCSGLVAACAILLATLGVFHFVQRDNLFLHEVAVAERPITEEEVDRVESIYNSTLAQTYPSTDRLVLLMGATARLNKSRETDQVTMLLAPRDRRNLDLQFALAQILDNTKQLPRAEEEYQKLLQRLEDGSIPASRKRDLLLGAARASAHAGNIPRASERFRDLLHAWPEDAAIRNEFAGVLMGAGSFEAAAQVYDGTEPDLNGRLLLVAIHAQNKNFAAAERECRTIGRLRPDDPQAKLLLADVLTWKSGGNLQSQAIYEQLLKVNGGDPALLVRLAQIALWTNSYDEALQRYQKLLDRQVNTPEVIKGYVDAAASARSVDESQHKTALAIYERALTGMADDVVFLTRLAWVLQRVQEPDKSAVLLDRALELNPTDTDARRQLLGALLATGRVGNQLKEFEGKELDFDTRQCLVHVFMRQNNFDAAASQCRQMLKLRPEDQATLRQLADILSWSKHYPEALELFGRLARVAPPDSDVPQRQAEVTLWSGDYDGALGRFHALLQADLNRQELWPNYAAAAANAKNLEADHKRMLLRIYDATGPTVSRDPVFLGRLAWALQRLQETDRAGTLLDRAVAMRPGDPAVRRELAGVLAAVGKTNNALQMYEGLPLTLEDRYRLSVLYAAAKDFGAAEKQCRAILSERPEDRPARRQLADVLSWKKDYPEALRLFEKLARENPQDPELPVRLAEVALWSGAYNLALARYQALLESRPEQPHLWVSFVDAAAGAGALDERQAALALQIEERVAAQDKADTLFLTRLAWVMVRLKQSARAEALLERARAAHPQEPAVRKELAGVLAAVGQTKAALQLYEGLKLEPADRYRLAELHTAESNFTAAEQQLRAILQAKPADQRALRQLADVLTWKKEYREANQLLEKLARAHPQDHTLAVRLAEVRLWSGDHDGALARLQMLLEARIDEQKLWPAFVNAAAGASKLNEAQAALAVRIAERCTTSEDPIFLTRLASVLQRVSQPVRAKSLIDRVLTFQPPDPATRKELAGVLAATGNIKAALRLYEGMSVKSAADRYQLASLYAADKDFAASERLCRAILQDNAQDRKARRLLAGLLSWKKDYPAAVALLQQLAAEDPTDADLPLKLAEVLVWSGDYEHALPRLQDLLTTRFEQLELWELFVNAAASTPQLTSAQGSLAVRISENITPAKSTDVAFLARLAWVLYRTKEPARAGTLLDRALSLKPADPGVRRELAGTCAAVGRVKDSLTMYEGIALELDDRYQLIGNYARARSQCALVLEERPDDLDAKKLLAYVQGWEKVVQESLALFRKLAQESPQDRRLQGRHADVTLWSGDFNQALDLFQVLIDEQFDAAELRRSYLDAAASSTRIFSRVHHQTALRIYEACAKSEISVEYLSRLAWVLYRLKEEVKVNRLLDRALALRPTEPAPRRELAGMLATVGRPKEARALYAGLSLTFADRYHLAELDAASGNLNAAETQVRALLKVKPDDVKVRLLLASILSSRKQFAEAAVVYKEVLRDQPDDAQVRVKIAELMLWSGDYDNALVQFQKIFDGGVQEPRLWKAYVDAAASAHNLPENARPTAVDLFEKTVKAQDQDAVFLTRLAWVLRRVHEPARSTVLLEKVISRDPGNRSVRLQLAEALYEMGEYQRANEHFGRLLDRRSSGRQGGPGRLP